MLLASDPEIIRDTTEVTKHHAWQSRTPKLGKLLALFAAVSEFVKAKALGFAVIILRNAVGRAQCCRW